MLNEKYFGSIIDSFIKCQPEYKKYPLEKSEYWDVHWREKGHLYNLLNKTDPNVQKRNLPIIINYLENFRFNSNLSKNLDDSYMDLSKDKSNYIHYSFINGILNSSDSIGKEFVWENADSINVGNNNTSILLNGKYIDRNEIVHLVWYKRIKDYISGINIFCEIGGGYGHFCKVMVKNHDCKCISIDLPEGNVLQSYYLASNFLTNGKKIIQYSDLDGNNLSEKQLYDNDIFILPPWVNYPDSFSFDFVMNSRSMMEMNIDTVFKYFTFIHKYINSDGYFLNINRYSKSSDFFDYPYDCNWDVLLSEKSYKQPSIHFLLTKRIFNGWENNILDEMSCIYETVSGTEYYK